MTLAYPWSGSDWGGGVPLSGRAAIPVRSGSGFNWRSVIRNTVGLPRGMRGLGQDGGAYVPPPPSAEVNIPPGGIWGNGSTPSTSTEPWWMKDIFAPVFKAGTTIASYELNPLYQKQIYQQTPQGVFASNVPTGYVPGLTTAAGGISLLPILLIGGLVLLFVARR